MIQISSAGGGSLVGGLVVGCYRTLTGEFAAGVVGPECFQNSDPETPNRFRRKAYLAEAVRVVMTCLAQLQATAGEEVTISAGHELTGVRDWLTEAGYVWQIGAPSEALKILLAQQMQQHLNELGLQVGLDLLTDRAKAGLLWWQGVRWLKGGDVNRRGVEAERARCCKTGWERYTTWALHTYQEAKRLTGKGGP